MTTKKVELADFMNFLIEFSQGKFPHQRLGQAFMNTMIDGESNSDIFYEKDRQTCINRIMKEYVDIGESTTTERKD